MNVGRIPGDFPPAVGNCVGGPLIFTPFRGWCRGLAHSLLPLEGGMGEDGLAKKPFYGFSVKPLIGG